MKKTMLLKRMDETAFLGFNAWDFCVRSMAQPYGRLFLRSVILRHPLQTLSGVLRYRKHLRSLKQTDITPMGIASEADFQDALSNGNLLVGIGFCQKPLDPPCPAGRFNHQCLLLEQPQTQTIPAACIECPIRETAFRSIRAGASIYIMTSAVDIARDLLLPNSHPPYSYHFLIVCPYSIPPLTLAMNICGLRGFVFAFSQGDCRDYTAWLNADKGAKSEQTFLSTPSRERLMELLDTSAGARATSGEVKPDCSGVNCIKNGIKWPYSGVNYIKYGKNSASSGVITDPEGLYSCRFEKRGNLYIPALETPGSVNSS